MSALNSGVKYKVSDTQPTGTDAATILGSEGGFASLFRGHSGVSTISFGDSCAATVGGTVAPCAGACAWNSVVGQDTGICVPSMLPTAGNWPAQTTAAQSSDTCTAAGKSTCGSIVKDGTTDLLFSNWVDGAGENKLQVCKGVPTDSNPNSNCVNFEKA